MQIQNFLEKLINKDHRIELILHGHTHRYRNEEIDGIKIFNPGECAGMLEGNNAVGLVDLKNMKIKKRAITKFHGTLKQKLKVKGFIKRERKMMDRIQKLINVLSAFL